MVTKTTSSPASKQELGRHQAYDVIRLWNCLKTAIQWGTE